MEQTDNQDGFENVTSLMDYLKISIRFLWMYRILIIIISFLGAAGSVAFAIVTLRLPKEVNPLPNIYLAYTRVLIQEGSSGGNDNIAVMMSALGMNSTSNQGISSGALAQLVYNSFPFADKVIEEFDLIKMYSVLNDVKTNSRKLFYLNSSFTYDVRSGELYLSFKDADKYLATKIVIFMLEELQRWFREQGGAVSINQLNNIESKLVEVSAEIKILEDQIRAIQLKYGVLNIEDLAQAQQSLASNLNEQLMNLDLKISQQENASASYSPIEQGSIRSLRKEREDVAKTLAALEAGRPVGDKRYPPAKDLPNIAAEFAQLQLLYEIQSGIYLSLTEQYEVLKLSGGGNLSFTILEPAEVPEKKFGPSRSKLCVQMTLASFVFAVFLALFHFFLIKKNYRKLDFNQK